MNEQIIQNMVMPYVKNGAITYSEFDNIFYILSRKEQYAVVELLYKNGINLINENISEDEFVLEVDDEPSDDDFERLYDDAIFKDKGNASDDVMVNTNIKQSNEILCALIQQGNRQAEQDLCIKNKRLVDKYALMYQKRYANRLDLEDLKQVGFIGLIKAAKKFDVGQGNAFSTYAVWWIKQSITREIMDNGYAIRIPVHMMERINKVVSLDNNYASQQLNIEERICATAEELDLDEAKVKECLTLKNNYLKYASLDSPVGEEGEAVLGEFIPDEETPLVDEIVATTILKENIEEILCTLTEREEKVLRLRFGIDDGRDRTLEEVGKIYGVTRERIRQIEAKALRKLRNPLRSKKLKEFCK